MPFEEKPPKRRGLLRIAAKLIRTPLTRRGGHRRKVEFAELRVGTAYLTAAGLDCGDYVQVTVPKEGTLVITLYRRRRPEDPKRGKPARREPQWQTSCPQCLCLTGPDLAVHLRYQHGLRDVLDGQGPRRPSPSSGPC